LESGLFNGLWPIQIEKILLRAANPFWLQTAMRRRVAGVVGPVAEFAAVGFVIPAIIGLASILRKEISIGSEIASATAGRASHLRVLSSAQRIP
jgi:hypothetical protein